MINLLSKRKKENVIVNTKTKTTEEIINEIHDAFLTEVDRLLVFAKDMKSVETTQTELINKCKRLKSLGFTNTQEIQEAEKEIKRLASIQTENHNKQELIETINYFSLKYPHYKFITEDSVKEICKKYGLIYGEVSRYTGTVPDSNLKQMEEFSIKESDDCYQKKTTRISRYSPASTTIEFMNKDQCMSEKKYHNEFSSFGSSRTTEVFEKSPLEIVAPQNDFNDFNFDDAEIKNFKIVEKIKQIPDPIVLKPVIFRRQKYYLVVTAWGKEASDDLVVNEKMN